MRFAASLVAGLVLTLGATVSAQTTSVDFMPYGQPGLYQSPIDPALFLNGTEINPNIAELRLVGGFAGDPVVLMIAGAPAQLPLGNGANVYVAPPMIPVWGVFDPVGEWAIRIPTTDPTLAGASLYFQGVDVMVQTGGLSLSNGLAVSFPL